MKRCFLRSPERWFPFPNAVESILATRWNRWSRFSITLPQCNPSDSDVLPNPGWADARAQDSRLGSRIPPEHCDEKSNAESRDAVSASGPTAGGVTRASRRRAAVVALQPAIAGWRQTRSSCRSLAFGGAGFTGAAPRESRCQALRCQPSAS